jgi:hypothetical protein
MKNQKTNCSVKINHPEIYKMLVQVAAFSQEYTTPRIAKKLDVTKQAMAPDVAKARKVYKS